MLNAGVGKRFQHRLNFDSTCFNAVERWGRGGGGGEGKQFQHRSLMFKLFARALTNCFCLKIQRFAVTFS